MVVRTKTLVRGKSDCNLRYKEGTYPSETYLIFLEMLLTSFMLAELSLARKEHGEPQTPLMLQ